MGQPTGTDIAAGKPESGSPEAGPPQLDILMVEDSRSFALTIKRAVEQKLGLPVTCAYSFAETRREVLSRLNNPFFLAIADIVLPDAPRGEVIDFLLEKNIPCIVFTGTFDQQLRSSVLSKQIVDYIIKEGPVSTDYLTALLRRIYKNREITVLVVDDSTSSRRYVANLLRIHQYKVIEAENAMSAIKNLHENDEIKLVITDYDMPDMDGFRLTSVIRQKYRREELAIIGISAHGDNVLSARFIKNGANDFLRKPFLTEEFYCRITQNIELIEHIQALTEASYLDHLTGLRNRRYFFETAEDLFKNAIRDKTPLTLAMIDIDLFKNINDTYGHEVGDRIIVRVATTIKESFSSPAFVTRFGGEEFCVLAPGLEEGRAEEVFDRLRSAIESSTLQIEGEEIRATVSIGLRSTPLPSLEAMVRAADEALYQAKREGRNRLVTSKDKNR